MIEKIIRKLLDNVYLRVLIWIASNIIQSISPRLWDIIEKKVFNPYTFWENTLPYYKEITDKFVDYAREISLDFRGKTLLELGPGGFLGVWAYLKSAGLGKYLALDVVNHFDNVTDEILALYTTVNPTLLINNVLDRSYFDILIYQDKKIPLENASMDITFSHYVYEHITDPESSIAEVARITKSGWYGIHEIEYGDHIFDRESLFFRTIPEFLFKWLFWKSGWYVNRKTHNAYKEMFVKYGFEVVYEKPVAVYQDAMVEKYINKLPGYSREDIRIEKWLIIVKKI